MESIIKESNKAMAVEVLFFEEAQVEKIKGTALSFGAMGPLSVLYFKDYHRFVLQINDWKYPLVRRLPIIASSDKNDMSSRSYILPAANGFAFELKLTKISNLNVLLNFETILSNNANFSFNGEETPFKKIESSPDDKLVRSIKKETGLKEMIASKVDNLVDKVKIKAATMKTGTKHLTSTKKRINPKDIKNKNFKKTAHSTFKKDFFESSDKLAKEFMSKRKDNINLSMTRQFADLMKTSTSAAPVLFITKDDIEESILINKELAVKGGYNLSILKTEEKKGFMDTLKQGLTEIKESIVVSRAEPAIKSEKMAGLETMEHYQG